MNIDLSLRRLQIEVRSIEPPSQTSERVLTTVIRWDNAIFEAQEQLSSTAAHVTRIENQQERIEAELSYITKSQKQIETDLQVAAVRFVAASS